MPHDRMYKLSIVQAVYVFTYLPAGLVIFLLLGFDSVIVLVTVWALCAACLLLNMKQQQYKY